MSHLQTELPPDVQGKRGERRLAVDLKSLRVLAAQAAMLHNEGSHTRDDGSRED